MDGDAVLISLLVGLGSAVMAVFLFLVYVAWRSVVMKDE